MNLINKAFKKYEERGGELNSREDELRALVEYRNDVKNTVRKYSFEAVVKCKLSGEVIGKIFSFSLEGLEEELYKLEEAVKRDDEIIKEELNEWFDNKYK